MKWTAFTKKATLLSFMMLVPMHTMAVIRCVCFDVGGVLAKISLNWEDISKVSGVPIRSEKLTQSPQSILKEFKKFEEKKGNQQEYLSSVANCFDITEEEARRAHAAILRGPYEGMLEIVHELHDQGIHTGCLSNTNEMHWEVLCDPTKYPTIHALKTHVLSFEVGCSKPEEMIYKAFEQATGFQSSEIIFFDDIQAHIEGAKKLNWNAYLIDPKGDVPQQIRDILVQAGVTPH